jgi:hypothetical protein
MLMKVLSSFPVLHTSPTLAKLKTEPMAGPENVKITGIEIKVARNKLTFPRGLSLVKKEWTSNREFSPLQNQRFRPVTLKFIIIIIINIIKVLRPVRLNLRVFFVTPSSSRSSHIPPSHLKASCCPFVTLQLMQNKTLTQWNIMSHEK